MTMQQVPVEDFNRLKREIEFGNILRLNDLVTIVYSFTKVLDLYNLLVTVLGSSSQYVV